MFSGTSSMAVTDYAPIYHGFLGCSLKAYRQHWYAVFSRYDGLSGNEPPFSSAHPTVSELADLRE